MKTQNNQILEWLQQGKPINPMQALNRFGCFRLSARIKNLRDKGINIETTISKGEKNFAIYTLINGQ